MTDRECELVEKLLKVATYGTAANPAIVNGTPPPQDVTPKEPEMTKAEQNILKKLRGLASERDRSVPGGMTFWFAINNENNITYGDLFALLGDKEDTPEVDGPKGGAA